jgi:hypothetical protein
VGVGLRGRRLLRRRHLGADPLQLGVESRFVGQQHRQLLVPLVEGGLELLDLLERLARDGRAVGRVVGSKLSPAGGRPLRA